MSSTPSRVRAAAKLGVLLNTASAFVLASATAAFAQPAPQMMAQNEPPPEQVLVTGSLIRGTVAVGVPVTNLGMGDFKQTGSITIADLLTNIPAFQDKPSAAAATGGPSNFLTGINIHNLNGTGQRTLMLIDGMRFALQRSDETQYDPSIIPAIALERIDVLTDGASATYGSDAVAGVVNVILRRGFDGAITQANIGTASNGGFNWSAAQLFGRTWDSGDITVSFQHDEVAPIYATDRSYYTQDFRPWGLDNLTPIKSADPGIVSTGAPNALVGTGCTNCFSIPKGQNGVGLTWAQLLANAGSGNEVNPTTFQKVTPVQNNNAATLTFDQNVVPGVQFNAEAFYSNRRVKSTAAGFTQTTGAIPTSYPFYPTGAPAGLRVSYSFGPELLQTESALERSERYSAGLTIQLPGDWQAKIFGSLNEERNYRHTPVVNMNNVNAALGATIAATAATASSPGIPSFTRPSSVPYLNLFCDPTAFQCIDPATMAFIEKDSTNGSTYLLHQYGANFDGSLFRLPAGLVRAAVGASYEKDDYSLLNETNPVTTAITVESPDNLGRTILAEFTQVNVPVFGDGYALPLVQRLDLEFSYRHDHYSDFGGTNNPRIAANWTVTDGLVLRASWGTSFRAPTFKDLSAVVARGIGDANVPGGGSTGGGGAMTLPACAAVGGTPVPGSVAAILNPTCSAGAQFPVGVEITGGVADLPGVTRPANYALGPEKGKNWSLGFDYTPTNFLPGLSLSAALYRVFIEGPINPVRDNIGAGLNDPNARFAYFIRGVDPEFNTALAWAFANPLAGSNLTNITPSQVLWINDGASRNAGTEDQRGIDFSASYDWDLGDYGAWNTGITGTYKIHDISANVVGAPGQDIFNVGGQTQDVRLKYRGRLGWSSGPYSMTGFVDYQSHFYTVQAFPPASFLATFPNYSNLVPGTYFFDLALEYDLGDLPANTYLKGIAFQFVVNNIMDRTPPFVYGGTGSAFAYDGRHYNPYGRTLRFGITKTW